MSAESRREQILDIAHAIVAAEGFHAATPNRIAEAAGITRPVLYQQFGDLAGVFVALIDREAARAAAQFAEAVSHPGEPVDPDPFISTFAGVVRAIDTHPATWRLFLFPPAGAPPELHRRLAQSQEVVRAYLEQPLQQAFPALPDPEYTARILHASGRELLQLRLTDPANATTDRLIALVSHQPNQRSSPAGFRSGWRGGVIAAE
ncbi:TetR family transcriptional regulator [Nocardia seriolae]|uniref:TetR/AcrR family transcriptional regulator n=1 Tax=Nocardia seriolae TaxID=37332 RepID=UPI0012BD0015|nr:TetR/AcrR family transcriptional regulator [Nocardia seriolae]MTL15160.1 TetR family transcriptional regulator [Nocardia seriolae]